MSDKITEAMESYKLSAEASGGCGDGNCVVLKPVGMHTNGGCRCSDDRMKAQRMMRAGQRLYEAIAADQYSAQAGLEEARFEAQHNAELWGAAEKELIQIREQCPLCRRQDYFEVSTIDLVKAQVSEMFSWQSRAERFEAEASDLRRKLEEAERDRDQLLLALDRYPAGARELHASLTYDRHRAEAAERKLEEARKALEPFARAAGYLTDANGWCDTDGMELCYDDGRRLSVIQLSAFRAAALALAASPSAQTDGGGDGR